MSYQYSEIEVEIEVWYLSLLIMYVNSHKLMNGDWHLYNDLSFLWYPTNKARNGKLSLYFDLNFNWWTIFFVSILYLYNKFPSWPNNKQSHHYFFFSPFCFLFSKQKTLMNNSKHKILTKYLKLFLLLCHIKTFY